MGLMASPEVSMPQPLTVPAENAPSAGTMRMRNSSPSCQESARALPEDADRILEEQLPQVRFIARYIHRSMPQHVPFDDILQAGLIGLLDAMTKYDPRRGVGFGSYAKFRIRGAILDSLREMDWGPRGLRRSARSLDQAHARAIARLGREPSEPELASELGVELPELQSLKQEISALKFESVWGRTTHDGEEGDPFPIAAPLAETPLFLCARSEAQRLLTLAVAELPRKQQEVIRLYYCEHLLMKEVGSVLGLCESRVSQIHSAALRSLKLWLVLRLGPIGDGLPALL
jgi:RNA polymerase sigma factor for flagellar operon FliA